jgi:sarcosine oxidase subunit beta
MGRHPAERALALEALSRWPELSRELGAETKYRRDGGLRIAMDASTWSAAPAWVAEQRADGVPVEAVDAATVHRLAPGASEHALGGVYCAIDGQAEAMPATQAFAAGAKRLGASVVEGIGATRLIVERGCVVAVERVDGTRESCDVAILTGGTWSAGLLAPHGVTLPFETRALQMLLTAPAPKALAPVIGAFDRRLSLKQLADGSYLIGGGWPAKITDEPNNTYVNLDESIAGSREVSAAVYPPAGRCALARSWAGLEAFTPDEIPVLGPVRGIGGLLVAAGFCGHGFALAPAVGDVLARLVLGRDGHEHLWRRLALDRPALEAVTR